MIGKGSSSLDVQLCMSLFQGLLRVLVLPYPHVDTEFVTDFVSLDHQLFVGSTKKNCNVSNRTSLVVIL